MAIGTRKNTVHSAKCNASGGYTSFPARDPVIHGGQHLLQKFQSAKNKCYNIKATKLQPLSYYQRKPIQNLMKKNRKEIFSVFNEILFSDGKY
jgi:hypothetical protein